jgi:hypothetical protein
VLFGAPKESRVTCRKHRPSLVAIVDESIASIPSSDGRTAGAADG